MSTSAEPQKTRLYLERGKWLIIAVLLITAIVGNYYYRDLIAPLRTLVVVFMIISAGIIVLFTTKGKNIISFAREARTEIRKVIWPTSQQTLHTTLIIAIATTVLSMILWGQDSILVCLVSFITGLRF